MYQILVLFCQPFSLNLIPYHVGIFQFVNRNTSRLAPQYCMLACPLKMGWAPKYISSLQDWDHPKALDVVLAIFLFCPDL